MSSRALGQPGTFFRVKLKVEIDSPVVCVFSLGRGHSVLHPVIVGIPVQK